MFSDLKAMVVVLVTAVVVFALAKPLCLRFMLPDDFARRRNLWLLMTAAGFLSPNIWVYLLFAAPALAWTASRDSNPAALYFLLMFAVPPVSVDIPTILINQLFTISQSRLLSLLLLLPIAVGLLRSSSGPRPPVLKLMDGLLLSYGILQLVLFMPYESGTNTMRRGVLFYLDTFLVYYVFSRVLAERPRMVDAMAALCLSCAVLAPLAVFESLRSWLLYTTIPQTWGSPNTFSWLLRDSSLRAQVSTGHSITFGYLMATGLAFWLYLKAAVRGMWLGPVFLVALCLGLLVSYARATWIMAALLPILVVALAPNRSRNLFKGLVTVFVLLCALFISPMGGRVVDLLPFIGTGDQGTVEYRQQLAETSWMLVQQNPLLGNPFALLQMENLRQGQGIIDIVNEYAAIAVFYGLVGLGLFVAFFVTSVAAAYRRLGVVRAADPDLAAMGAALVACMVATLVFIATVPGAWFQWALGGMLAAYSQIAALATEPVEETAARPAFYARHAVG